MNTDNQHTVFVWRWSKGGDDAALERAKNAAAWRFGPEKRVKDRLEFYEKKNGAESRSGAKAAATAAPSRAALAAAAGGGAVDLETGAMTSTASSEASQPGIKPDDVAWQRGDGTYELVGEGAGMNGLPPMVYGVAWNPFPGMDEFVTYGVKHLKVWRAIDLNDGSPPRWVGELASRNDGRRVADCSAKQARFVNDGNPGGGYVAPPTPDPEDPEYADDFDDDDVGAEKFDSRHVPADGGSSPAAKNSAPKNSAPKSAIEKGKRSLNASMTSLASFKKSAGVVNGAPLVQDMKPSVTSTRHFSRPGPGSRYVTTSRSSSARGTAGARSTSGSESNHCQKCLPGVPSSSQRW